MSFSSECEAQGMLWTVPEYYPQARFKMEVKGLLFISYYFDEHFTMNINDENECSISICNDLRLLGFGWTIILWFIASQE